MCLVKFFTIIPAIVLISTVALAGNLYPPGSPEKGSGMCTLDELYDYLTLGIYPEPHEVFREPSDYPGPTMKTIQEILEAAATLFNQAEVAPADVMEGVIFFSTQPATWGPQKGTLPKMELSPGSTTVEAGYYAATTLDVIDPDLTSSRIESGIGIFGVEGSYSCPDGDWRLPTRRELQTLTHGDEQVMSETPRAFVEVISSFYLSSTTFYTISGLAYCVA